MSKERMVCSLMDSIMIDEDWKLYYADPHTIAFEKGADRVSFTLSVVLGGFSLVRRVFATKNNMTVCVTGNDVIRKFCRLRDDRIIF